MKEEQKREWKETLIERDKKHTHTHTECLRERIKKHTQTENRTEREREH
jgi:hypothetical protein